MKNRPIAVALLTALSGAAMYGLYAGLAGAAAVAVPACTSADGSIGLNPITGIVIRSESLIAGHGCGQQAGQVYKYAAIVTLTEAGDAGPEPSTAAGVYDCFADGTFANLPASPVGGTAFTVSIYAFDSPTWNANADAIQTAVVLSSGADDAGVPLHPFDPLLAPIANWTTTCSATQQSDIEVLAVCGELTATGH